MVHASSTPIKLDVYRPRKPQDSAYYRCVEDCFETFEQVYQERFEQKYGFFRPYVGQVMLGYLDCGILKNGFARVRCEHCGHEYLLAHSCKRRHFCPSCHQKRVVEFGEWLCQEVVKAVPHRHAVLSIPKILRRYFLYDRSLLSDLSRCGWEALKAFYTNGVRESKAVPGAVVAFSQERMSYHRETGHVEYKSKDGSQTKVFDALEWLAAMCSHVPNKGEQMARYYGYYSNVARGKRKKTDADDKSRLGLGAASVAAQYVVTHPQPSHNPINLDFLLDPLSKSEFLSFP